MPRKQRTGVVVSDKMDKTVVVQVERTVVHPRYRKVIRRRKRFKAHDETNRCRTGDRVLIEETRPLSRDKHWRILTVLERHEVAEVQPREIDAAISGSAPRGVARPQEPQPPPGEPGAAGAPAPAVAPQTPGAAEEAGAP